MLPKISVKNHTPEILALKTLRANVMLADTRLNILYINNSLSKLLTDAEPELKRELPRFSMATLIGSNIDIFHKNPSHQRGMLAVMETEHNATIKVGNRMFDLVVNPLKQRGKRVGFVVEWSDAQIRLRNMDYAAQNVAFGRSNAMISFKPDGTIISANENFIKLMGYSLADIVGQHHSIFMEPHERQKPEYKVFWENLARGQFQAGDFRRILKNGQGIWLHGSYNPVLDDAGKVIRVEKFATDVSGRVNSVDAVGKALAGLAEGDLTVRIDQALTVELDQLRTNFNRALDQLQGSMRSVGESAGAIEGGSGEIRAAADELSQRTERQAANLEETAAALDEITATVRATSENSSRARQIVAGAKTDAEASATVVGSAVEAMRQIEETSKKIGQIIGVIDEIAFQTNLLALNAGVEAARAGDAGRGFAVVATEVRALAQRSAEAAKEIKGLISTSAGQVEEGVKLVEQTGHVLHSIIGQVNEINETVGSIAASAQEQASGLATVNQSMNEMDQVTQQNAAMVQQTTAAARELSEETANLSQRVKQFRFDTAGAATREVASRAVTVRPSVVQPSIAASRRRAPVLIEEKV